MRILHSLPAMLISLLFTTGVQAQEATGLPGDNFSLEGALEMFKRSGNPGEFEKMLNTKKNGVNNLDLNRDGKIDYVRVVNKKDRDVQIFVLQALVSKKESQDIAVIALEKTGDEEAMIQITGDKDIYGVAKIVEPSSDDVTAFNDGVITDRPHGPNASLAPAGIYVNVWFWPSVRYVFAPYYDVWVSPWHWYHYPTWWDPWRPLAWDAYYPICYRYRPTYIVVHTHRIVRAPHIYRPMRVYSRTVYNRNRLAVNNYRARHSAYNRSTPRRQFDRDARTSPRQFDRDSRRVTSPRQVDRDARTSPRQIDRDSRRVTSPRQIDRNPRSVPAPRQIDRNSRRATSPQRQVERSARPASPARQVDRGARRVTSSQMNRSPQRQIDRRSATTSRPQMSRSPRTISPQRSAPRPQMNRSASPQRQSPVRSAPNRRL